MASLFHFPWRCSVASGILSLAWFALTATTLEAGDLTGGIRGSIKDIEGSPLAEVEVVLENSDLGVSQIMTRGSSLGAYEFTGLPEGDGYKLTFRKSGFSVIAFTGIPVRARQPYILNVVLAPAGSNKEVIEVRGRSLIVSQDTALSSTSFSAEFISGLPILGRDYQDILSLAPGVTDVNKTGNPNIYGARDTGLNTLMDGVSITDPLTGYFGQNLNIETIEALEVVTSGAPAEYSRAQGGFANITTKSGGNEFRGAFKLFLRSSRLDGDGAGVDPPETQGGLGGTSQGRELTFSDYYPFLSFSGPMLPDRAWYYLAGEFLQVENPVNTLTQAYVTGTRGHSLFGKATWQASPANKIAFSAAADQTSTDNQGITGHTDLRSGFSLERGGTTLTLLGTSVLAPTRLLESRAAWFDNSFERSPTTDPDTNGNGLLFVDWNGDGFLEARERDPGEDWDRDRAYDIYEKVTDIDGDGRVNGPRQCEGFSREDFYCNGIIDAELDRDLDGQLDPNEDVGIDCFIGAFCPGNVVPGTQGNGRFDTEDKNGNGQLDTLRDSGYTPFPFWSDANQNGRPDFGEYESPIPPDLDFLTDDDGRTYGPNPYQYEDHRRRFTLREDLSLFLDSTQGTHDLKLGGILELEDFERDTLRRSITRGGFVEMGFPISVTNTASGRNLGLYVQDFYKPLPNLSIGLGLRYDFEQIESFGYSPFDPVKERASFDKLQALSGVGVETDGVRQLGLCADPLNIGGCGAGMSTHLSAILTTIRAAMPSRLTRHFSDFEIHSERLSQILGRDVSIDDLLAAGVNIRRPQERQWSNSNLAPRLSISWDPGRDGKTNAFGSWGRYYDRLFLDTVILEEGPDLLTRQYAQDADRIADDGRPNNGLGHVISQSAPSVFAIDPELSTPYTDEWTLGIRRELNPEFWISAKYIRRDYRDQLQDLDANHQLRTDPITGKLADEYGILRCVKPPTSIPCTVDPEGLPDLVIQNFYFNQILFLGNLNQQSYRGWELELKRRLSRRWEFEASYTLSETYGDAESFLSEQGNDPSLGEFESGFLDYDQRHVVKLNAVTYLPRNWRLGGTAQWASGLPYSSVVRIDSTDDAGYSQPRVVYGERGSADFSPEGRNTHRNAAVYDFNARVEKHFVMGRASTAIFFEVYNLLNSDDLRVTAIESRTRNAPAGGEIVNASTDLILLIEGERRFGRRYQVGIQIDF